MAQNIDYARAMYGAEGAQPETSIIFKTPPIKTLELWHMKNDTYVWFKDNYNSESIEYESKQEAMTAQEKDNIDWEDSIIWPSDVIKEHNAPLLKKYEEDVAAQDKGWKEWLEETKDNETKRRRRILIHIWHPSLGSKDWWKDSPTYSWGDNMTVEPGFRSDGVIMWRKVE